MLLHFYEQIGTTYFILLVRGTTKKHLIFYPSVCVCIQEQSLVSRQVMS